MRYPETDRKKLTWKMKKGNNSNNFVRHYLWHLGILSKEQTPRSVEKKF
jgi:hypothetical protein